MKIMLFICIFVTMLVVFLIRFLKKKKILDNDNDEIVLGVILFFEYIIFYLVYLLYFQS